MTVTTMESDLWLDQTDLGALSDPSAVDSAVHKLAHSRLHMTYVMVQMDLALLGCECASEFNEAIDTMRCFEQAL